MIIEDCQTGVVRQTSVDCCEPVDPLAVNLVTRVRLVYRSSNFTVTAHLCSVIKYKGVLHVFADAIVWWLVCSTSDREVVGSNPAGCGPSRSNRGPVALCTLGLGLLNPPSFRGQ